MATTKKTAGRKPATVPAAKRRGTEPGKKRGPYKPRVKKAIPLLRGVAFAASVSQSLPAPDDSAARAPLAMTEPVAIGEIPGQVHDLTIAIASLEAAVEAVKQKLAGVTKASDKVEKQETKGMAISQAKTGLGRDVEHLAARVRQTTSVLCDQIDALGL
jgi:hypothetical protein